MNKIMAGLGLAIALAAVGCGGSQKKDTTPKESPCVPMAAHVADVLAATVAKESDETKAMAAKIAPLMQKVMAESCQADAWSPAVIDCISKADAAAMDGCSKMLTPEQNKAMEDRMKAEMASMGGGEGAAESAPPGDPCGAGADPCGGAD